MNNMYDSCLRFVWLFLTVNTLRRLLIQVVPEWSVRRREEALYLQLPRALVTAANMQPGVVTLESEDGDNWQSAIVECALQSPAGRFGHRIYEHWEVVVAALQITAGQTISLAALDPSHLRISLEGQKHFTAAAELAAASTAAGQHA